ncbi:MAG: mechanosensitive ion channel family protein [Gemmatimonadota bacterium]
MLLSFASQGMRDVLTGAAAQDAAGARGWFPGLNPEVEAQLLATALVILALFLARRLVMRVVGRRVEDPRLRYRWSKGVSYSAFVIGVLVLFQIWVTAIPSLGTFLGLATAGLAIALKDLVADLAGWLFILWRRPFELGDRIALGSYAGDVVDIRVFAFTIMEVGNWVGADQSTGRIVHIPNAQVFSQAVANYTGGFPFIWNELPVLVTFESDWKKAKGILHEIATEEASAASSRAQQYLRKTTQRFLIHYRKLTPIVFTSVEDSGVLLTIRYLCDPRARRGTAEALWERILEAFAKESDIDFAYPTQRVYVNPLEGKEGARAPLPPFTAGELGGPKGIPENE